jgi:TonB family protein
MPLIQIPLQPPSPPPPRPGHHPDQGDLFDTNSWESAYRELHDFPTLLIQTRDELARSRKREAFWISLIAHIVLVLLIINSPKFEKYLPHRAVMLVHTGRDDNKLTFLAMPPDAQKVPSPKSNVISDKNRVAMSRAPKLDQKDLKKILDASRQGRPGPVAPPIQQQPAPPATAAQAAPAPPQPQQPAPQPPPDQVAKLQAPPVARKPAPAFDTGPMSASRSVAEAARQAAENHRQYGGDEGDLGLGQRQLPGRMGPMEILTDTQGVDFGPYLAQVLHIVKQNWYSVIPESAGSPLYKRGKVSIEFAITKNGQVEGLHYVSGSGDVALDRAAYGGITASNPFPPLPREFGGQYLGLRFSFFYNPDPNEADLH